MFNNILIALHPVYSWNGIDWFVFRFPDNVDYWTIVLTVIRITDISRMSAVNVREDILCGNGMLNNKIWVTELPDHQWSLDNIV